MDEPISVIFGPKVPCLTPFVEESIEGAMGDALELQQPASEALDCYEEEAKTSESSKTRQITILSPCSSLRLLDSPSQFLGC